MIRARQFLLLFVLLFGGSAMLRAQLTLSDTLSKTEMLQTLFGNGVYISNLTYTFCDTTNAMREFDATNTNLGLGRGVLLSTGEAMDAANPGGLASCNVTGSTNLGRPGYSPLNALLPPGFTTNDACRISFNITPLCDTIAIKYVFASEEYPFYVNSSFNDVFAFWISGPGYGAVPGTNISVIPGTTTPVTINNINNGQGPNCVPSTGPCTNCAYYVDNQAGTTVAYNAWTTPLLAEAVVIPCSTYTITIAIADAGDFILDSGVFLEAGGIGCTSPSLQLAATNSTVLGSNIAVEGCVNYGQFTFSLPYPLTDTTVFRYQISGTATPGIDYVPFPDSIVMPAGQTTITVPVYIYEDSISEGSEFIQIYYVDSALCGTFVYQDTAIMEILDKPSMPDVHDLSLCPGETKQIPLSGVSSPGMTFQWTPGQGLSSNNNAFTFVTLPNATTNSVTRQYILTTIDLQGYCINNDTIIATVHPRIDTDFQADTVCFGVNTTFQDLTVTDSIASHRWVFGDGSLSPDAGPVHLYANPGLFQVKLVTENIHGCRDSLIKPVLVDSLPVASFTANPACDGAPVFFQNDVRPQTTYAWRFGDGTTSAAGSPNHVYPGPGSYIVTMVATTAAGCQDSLSREVQVYANPAAAFSFVENCDGQAISFAQQATTGTGQNLTYTWQLGDGSTSSQADPSHLYGTFGIKQVRLTVTDEFGCTSNLLQEVEVFPLPIADFQADPLCEQTRLTPVNLSTVAAGKDIVGYFWDFGYDSQTSTFLEANVSYNEEGTYTIFLRVETENGCRDSVSKTVDIYPNPWAKFASPSVCVSDEAVVFNFSEIPNPIFSDVLTAAQWSWGDGTETEGDTSSHRYQAFGTYPVTLRVVTDKGCEASFTRDLQIYPLPQDPAIVSDTVCFGDPAFLMAMAPSSVTVNWYYQVTDPAPFQQGYSYVTPPNTFPGTYFVEPVSEFGCIGARVPVSVEIFDEENGRIEASALVVEIPAAVVNFSISGSLRPVSYQWRFGDGNGSTSAEPAHEYQFPGIYEVEVKVIDANGCEFTFREYVEVKELVTIHVPSAFTPNGDGFNDELYLGWNLVHSLQFKLYNRWGQVVYETNDPDFRWNGIDPNGSPVPEGVYVFFVRAVDFQGRPIEKSGTMTILR